MFNPFERFEPKWIGAFLNAKQRYLVSQTYNRGYDHFGESPDVNLLFTEYDDISRASMHLGKLKNDKYGSIIDLENQKHVAKITSMCAENSGYKIWVAVVKSRAEIEARLNRKFSANIVRYVKKNTNWSVGGKEIKTEFRIALGAIIIILKFGGQKIEVDLEDIEKS